MTPRRRARTQAIPAARVALDRLAPALPAGWFGDPAHYERELECFWYDRWIAVLREESLTARGDYRTVTIGTQSIVVLRDDGGELRAYYNVCRHRGSLLVEDRAGRFTGGVITCPYHAWTYDLAGALTLTPRRMPTPDFDRRRFALLPVHVARWGGFVFLHLGREPAPLADALGDVPGRFARYEFARLRAGHRIVRDVAANWKLLAENFQECLHCPPVHPELCRIVPAYAEGGAWGLRGSEARAEYRSGARTLTLDGTARLAPFRGLDAEERARLYAAATVLPNLFLNVHPDYVHTHTMFPTGPTSVRMVYEWLFAPEAMPAAADDLAHYVALWERINAQDAHNCELQQRGLAARPFEHGWYVPQEFDAHRFAQWIRAGLGERAASGAKKRK